MASISSPDLDQRYRATSIFTPFDRPRPCNFPGGDDDTQKKVDNIIDVGSKSDLESPSLGFSNLCVEVNTGSVLVTSEVSPSKRQSNQGKPTSPSKISSRNKEVFSPKLSGGSTTVASTTKHRPTQ